MTLDEILVLPIAQGWEVEIRTTSQSLRGIALGCTHDVGHDTCSAQTRIAINRVGGGWHGEAACLEHLQHYVDAREGRA